MTDHPIPDAAFDEDAIVLAKKGAGKTVLSKTFKPKGRRYLQAMIDENLVSGVRL